ncbi:MAG: flagellar hook-length control protein FliK [Candidatus Kapaibacterium sp.]
MKTTQLQRLQSPAAALLSDVPTRQGQVVDSGFLSELQMAATTSEVNVTRSQQHEKYADSTPIADAPTLVLPLQVSALPKRTLPAEPIAPPSDQNAGTTEDASHSEMINNDCSDTEVVTPMPLADVVAAVYSALQLKLPADTTRVEYAQTSPTSAEVTITVGSSDTPQTPKGAVKIFKSLSRQLDTLQETSIGNSATLNYRLQVPEINDASEALRPMTPQSEQAFTAPAATAQSSRAAVDEQAFTAVEFAPDAADTDTIQMTHQPEANVPPAAEANAPAVTSAEAGTEKKSRPLTSSDNTTSEHKTIASVQPEKNTEAETDVLRNTRSSKSEATRTNDVRNSQQNNEDTIGIKNENERSFTTSESHTPPTEAKTPDVTMPSAPTLKLLLQQAKEQGLAVQSVVITIDSPVEMPSVRILSERTIPQEVQAQRVTVAGKTEPDATMNAADRTTGNTPSPSRGTVPKLSTENMPSLGAIVQETPIEHSTAEHSENPTDLDTAQAARPTRGQEYNRTSAYYSAAARENTGSQDSTAGASQAQSSSSRSTAQDIANSTGQAEVVAGQPANSSTDAVSMVPGLAPQGERPAPKGIPSKNTSKNDVQRSQTPSESTAQMQRVQVDNLPDTASTIDKRSADKSIPTPVLRSGHTTEETISAETHAHEGTAPSVNGASYSSLQDKSSAMPTSDEQSAVLSPRRVENRRTDDVSSAQQRSATQAAGTAENNVDQLSYTENDIFPKNTSGSDSSADKQSAGGMSSMASRSTGKREIESANKVVHTAEEFHPEFSEIKEENTSNGREKQSQKITANTDTIQSQKTNRSSESVTLPGTKNLSDTSQQIRTHSTGEIYPGFSEIKEENTSNGREKQSQKSTVNTDTIQFPKTNRRSESASLPGTENISDTSQQILAHSTGEVHPEFSEIKEENTSNGREKQTQKSTANTDTIQFPKTNRSFASASEPGLENVSDTSPQIEAQITEESAAFTAEVAHAPSRNNQQNILPASEENTTGKYNQQTANSRNGQVEQLSVQSGNSVNNGAQNTASSSAQNPTVQSGQQSSSTQLQRDEFTAYVSEKKLPENSDNISVSTQENDPGKVRENSSQNTGKNVGPRAENKTQNAEQSAQNLTEKSAQQTTDTWAQNTAIGAEKNAQNNSGKSVQGREFTSPKNPAQNSNPTPESTTQVGEEISVSAMQSSEYTTTKNTPQPAASTERTINSASRESVASEAQPMPVSPAAGTIKQSNAPGAENGQLQSVQKRDTSDEQNLRRTIASTDESGTTSSADGVLQPVRNSKEINANTAENTTLNSPENKTNSPENKSLNSPENKSLNSPENKINSIENSAVNSVENRAVQTAENTSSYREERSRLHTQNAEGQSPQFTENNRNISSRQDTGNHENQTVGTGIREPKNSAENYPVNTPKNSTENSPVSGNNTASKVLFGASEGAPNNSASKSNIPLATQPVQQADSTLPTEGTTTSFGTVQRPLQRSEQAQRQSATMTTDTHAEQIPVSGNEQPRSTTVNAAYADGHTAAWEEDNSQEQFTVSTPNTNARQVDESVSKGAKQTANDTDAKRTPADVDETLHNAVRRAERPEDNNPVHDIPQAIRSNRAERLEQASGRNARTIPTENTPAKANNTVIGRGESQQNLVDISSNETLAQPSVADSQPVNESREGWSTQSTSSRAADTVAPATAGTKAQQSAKIPGRDTVTSALRSSQPEQNQIETQELSEAVSVHSVAQKQDSNAQATESAGAERLSNQPAAGTDHTAGKATKPSGENGYAPSTKPATPALDNQQLRASETTSIPPAIPSARGAENSPAIQPKGTENNADTLAQAMTQEPAVSTQESSSTDSGSSSLRRESLPVDTPSRPAAHDGDMSLPHAKAAERTLSERMQGAALNSDPGTNQNGAGQTAPVSNAGAVASDSHSGAATQVSTIQNTTEVKHAAGTGQNQRSDSIAEQEAAGRPAAPMATANLRVNSPQTAMPSESSAARANSRNSQVEATETLPTGASEMPMQRGATEQAAPMNTAAQQNKTQAEGRDAAPASVSRSMAERKTSQNGVSRSVESQRKEGSQSVKPVSPQPVDYQAVTSGSQSPSPLGDSQESRGNGTIVQENDRVAAAAQAPVMSTEAEKNSGTATAGQTAAAQAVVVGQEARQRTPVSQAAQHQQKDSRRQADDSGMFFRETGDALPVTSRQSAAGEQDTKSRDDERRADNKAAEGANQQVRERQRASLEHSTYEQAAAQEMATGGAGKTDDPIAQRNQRKKDEPLTSMAAGGGMQHMAVPPNVRNYQSQLPQNRIVPRISAENFAASAVQMMQTMPQQSGGTMRLQLAPEALGTVTMQLNVRDKNAVVRLEVETTAAKQALEAQIPMLREQLGQQGITADKIDIQVRQREDFSMFSGFNQQNGSAKQEEQEARQSYLRSLRNDGVLPSDPGGHEDVLLPTTKKPVQKKSVQQNRVEFYA